MKRLAAYVLPILMVCFVLLTSCVSSSTTKNKIITWNSVNQKFMELEQARSKTMDFMKKSKIPAFLPSEKQQS